MPGLPKRKQLEAMIETAMLDRAPGMHAELKSQQGALQASLSARAEAAETTYQELVSQALTEASRESAGLSMPETVAAMNEARSRAAATAIDQAVEFAESQQTEAQTTALPLEA